MKEVFKTKMINTNGRRGGKVFSPNNPAFAFDMQMPINGIQPENTTNPEQLFAAGYASCFNGSMGRVMRLKNMNFISNVECEVTLLEAETGYSIAVELTVHVEGAKLEQAHELVEAAHQVCPYSKAVRNNIDVKINVI